MTDAGNILFPSITICKDQMFDHSSGLMKRLQSGELSVENASSWFRLGLKTFKKSRNKKKTLQFQRKRSFSRGRLVKFLSVNTLEGSNKYPCNTVGGPRSRVLPSHWSGLTRDTVL